MELSIENGKFIQSKGEYNFQEIIDDFPNAKKIRIITYNISEKSNGDILFNALSKLNDDIDVQIITNIPKRYANYYSNEIREKAKKTILNYFRKLDPNKYNAKLEIYFNFRNHAKIIGTENILYIGSANYSTESKNNYEAGVIIFDNGFITKLYAEYFEKIKAESLSYYNNEFEILRIQANRFFQIFVDQREKIFSSLYFTNGHNNEKMILDEPILTGEELEEFVGELQGLLDFDGYITNLNEKLRTENKKLSIVEYFFELLEIQWLIDICSIDDSLYELINFDYETETRKQMDNYAAYEEELEPCIENARIFVEEKYEQMQSNFADDSGNFISEINKIVVVIEEIYTILDKFSAEFINTGIDNT